MKTIIDIFNSFEDHFKLSEREKCVLQWRFGLGVTRTLPPPKGQLIHDGIPIGDNGHTLAEIGTIIRVQKQRIREIEATALRRLRHPSRFNIIMDSLREDPPSKDAAALIRILYPNRSDFLYFKFGIESEQDELTDFAARAVHLCYDNEDTAKPEEQPKPVGSPRRKKRPPEKIPG